MGTDSIIKACNKNASNASLVLSSLRQVTLHGVRIKRKKSQICRLWQSQQGRLKQGSFNNVEPEKLKDRSQKADFMQQTRKV